MPGLSSVFGLHGMMVLLFVFSFVEVFLVIDTIFDECPEFEFFSVEDVLVVRSLGLPEDFELWVHEHYELVAGVLGVPTDFMYYRLNSAYHGGSDGWVMDSYHDDGGFSLDELVAGGLGRDEVLRLYEDGCLIGGVSEVEDGGELFFARNQFEVGADCGVMLLPELFEGVRVFSRVEAHPYVMSDFLFYPCPDYGFLCPVELLLSGDEGLRALVVGDAYAYALKRRGAVVSAGFVRAGVSSVPVPGRVVELAEGGVVPSVGDGSLGALGGLAGVLGVSQAVLVRRFANVGERPVGVCRSGFSERWMAEAVGVSVDVFRGMCEVGDFVVERVDSWGEYVVSGVHFAPVFNDRNRVGGFVFFPDSLRLVDELRNLGWGDSRIVEFLEEPSPWFGLVAPVEYARLGGEYVDAVLEVAQYYG